jgi:hypothetical protein
MQANIDYNTQRERHPRRLTFPWQNSFMQAIAGTFEKNGVPELSTAPMGRTIP